MNLKLFISLLILASASTFFSACSKAENKAAKEVVIDNSSTKSSDEVYITNADLKDDKQPVSITQKGQQLEKRVLSDKSEIETLIDSFGNKVETRYFPGHPRLRMLIMRTSAKGAKEVTVYGNGGDTKIVDGLGEVAMTASGDDIANRAQLTATQSYGGAKNFMKGRGAQPSQSLQPLPSSAFQQPATTGNQPVQSTQQMSGSTTSGGSTQSRTTQQVNPEED